MIIICIRWTSQGCLNSRGTADLHFRFFFFSYIILCVAVAVAVMMTANFLPKKALVVRNVFTLATG